MVNYKTTKKSKKILETTLGKAPVEKSGSEEDISHLRRPIETSITGIKKLIAVFEEATNEVRDLLSYECDLLYECKSCRTIFRSIANLILHKRNFCPDKCSPLDYLNNNDSSDRVEEPITHNENKEQDTSSLARIIEKLKNRSQQQNDTDQDMTADLSEECVTEPGDLVKSVSDFSSIELENIGSNSAALFQTVKKDCGNNESMKTEVMENFKQLDEDGVVINREGKICGLVSSKLHPTALFPNSEFKCKECNNMFATQKSLSGHIKIVHNPTKWLYLCPTCKDPLSNPWGVYRHLLKVHKITNKQVRRMREQIHKSKVTRSEYNALQKKKVPDAVQGKTNNEKQWMDDIEGDKDFQMCAGCGKHFERKAALQSHMQLCSKRIEICQSIENNIRKEESPKKQTVDIGKISGACKRKGNMQIYKRKREKNHCVTSTESDSTSTENSPVKVTNSVLPETAKRKIDLETSPQETIISVTDKRKKLIPTKIIPEDLRRDSVSTDHNSTSNLPVEATKLSDQHETETNNSNNSNVAPEAGFMGFTKEEISNLLPVDSPSTPQANVVVDNQANFLVMAVPYMNLDNLECLPCKETFKSYDLLEWHMSLHFSWYRFQCGKCSFLTYNKFACFSHVIHTHSLRTEDASSYILPLPSWKAISFLHEFKHLNEIDANEEMPLHIDDTADYLDQNVDSFDETFETDSLLFSDCPKESEEVVILDNSDVKKKPTGKSSLDVPTTKEKHLLNVPIGLALPAKFSEVISSLKAEHLEIDLENHVRDYLREDSLEETKDEWLLEVERLKAGKTDIQHDVPQVNSELLENDDASNICTRLKQEITDVDDELKCDESINKQWNEDTTPKGKAVVNTEKSKVDIAASSRPTRVRTKVKMSDDFVYYD